MTTLKRIAAAAGLFALLVPGSVLAAGGAEHPKQMDWSFDGPFGTFDRAALQRGFQVYREVCSSCHSMKYLSYRNLGQPGGPEFSPEQVEAIAAEFSVPAGPDDNGEILDESGLLRTRPALPSDKFASPYPNEAAARAGNNGALPPDLSVIVKARHDGANYVYSLLSGYEEGEGRPACIGETPGQYYNLYFGAGAQPESCKDEHGHVSIKGSLISMAPPLPPDRVTYADGTAATTEQMAHDVATFLAWAAEPHLEVRKKLGFQTIAFLLVFAGFLYLSYRRIWSNVDH